MTRKLALLAGALAVALAGCESLVAPESQDRSQLQTANETRIVNDLAGSYQLRALFTEPDQQLLVPVSLPLPTPGDSLRVTEGAFTFNADKTWQVKVQTVPVHGGVAGTPNTRLESGSFAIKERTATRIVLDLYPGRFATADRPWSVSAAGDTVYYGNQIFVR
jgi:hypothetical protein